MFTGLIKDIGQIKKIIPNREGAEFIIQSTKLIQDIHIDDSVATDGVCLTATKIEGDCFRVQAIHVTLQKTNLGKLSPGSKVNLELALRASDRLGGHIVQGHVNDIAKISKITKTGKNIDVQITPAPSMFKYIIEEGSIAINGISLTVASRAQSHFSVSIIPHTFDNTTLHLKRIGDLVNIEVDIMAKYLENFLSYDKAHKDIKDLL